MRRTKRSPNRRGFLEFFFVRRAPAGGGLRAEVAVAVALHASHLALRKQWLMR